MSPDYRIEKDSLGEVRVPVKALYGAQTQRAIDNFPVSGLTLPFPFIQAVARIKKAAAIVNADLGELDAGRSTAIIEAVQEILDGQHRDQFPVDVFQTGSGTSTNMNVNEVIAALACRKSGLEIHANDHVNRGQSSNDTIPSAIHLSAALACHRTLLPALAHLAETIDSRANALEAVIKTGRTHLMDALPVRMGQELGGWALQIRNGTERIEAALVRIYRLGLGGTAVGTGVNAHPEFARRCLEILRRETGLPFETNTSFFESLSSQDAAVELSGQLKTLAVSLLKIANDLRWMNSGPLAGLGEIELPALQPGSSIMPGKVNPVIPEAAAMAAVRVVGNDAAITLAGASGNFQLNVMLPLIAYNLLQNIEILAHAARLLADKAIAGFKVRPERLAEPLEKNPMLATVLNPLVGYARAAEIAKTAYRQQRPIVEVAVEMTGLPRDQLERLLDPKRLV